MFISLLSFASLTPSPPSPSPLLSFLSTCASVVLGERNRGFFLYKKKLPFSSVILFHLLLYSNSTYLPFFLIPFLGPHIKQLCLYCFQAGIAWSLWRRFFWFESILWKEDIDTAKGANPNEPWRGIFSAFLLGQNMLAFILFPVPSPPLSSILILSVAY